MLNPQLMEQVTQRLGGSQDPLIGALLTSMMQGRSEEAEHAAESTRDADALLARCKVKMRRLRQDLDAANSMLHTISNVFGACELCWGEDNSCPRCHGRGHPGSSVPIHDEMLRWVEPALSRAGLRVAPLESPARPLASFHSGKENQANVR
jgi:hypothetical protein